MDRVSDEELEMMIDWWARPEVAIQGGLLVLPALTELRERRAAEKKDAIAHDQECAYCGEYHDNRVACSLYLNRQFPSPFERL